MSETDDSKKMEKLAADIAQKLNDSGYEAYFVGGCVRDKVMGMVPKDIDIATSARPDDVEKLFRKTVPVGKQFGVMLVIQDGIEFEVATFRSDGAYVDGRHPQDVHFSTAEQDAQRRDFTINGLFYDPVKKKVHDYVGGQEDIRNKCVRAIGDPHKRFDEDKLRIMRAIRFATRLEFDLDFATKNAIAEFISHINQVSQERIRDELVAMMTGPHPVDALRLLDEVGLLEIILPEVTEMKGVKQNPKFHPEGDVFVHTMLMMEKLSYPSLVLSFSALLHDVGKPGTLDPETLKTTFHADKGARMTEKIMRRLRFSNDEIEHVSWCVGNHMNFMHVQRMREGKLKRLMSLDTFADELELHHIDCASSHGMLDNYEFLLKKQEEFAKEDLKPKPLVNGYDLIELGLTPGPRFKDILDEAWTMQLEHAFSDRDAALRWLKKVIAKKETE